MAAARGAGTWVTTAECGDGDGGALETLRTVHGGSLRNFRDSILQAIGEAAGRVVAEAAAEDAFSKKVFESFLGFRKKAMAWSKYADQAFLDARLLPFTYGE